MPQRFLGKLLVRHPQELFHGLEDHDLRAESPPHAAEFEADHARADHAQPLRHGVELQRSPRIDDRLAVERHGFQLHRHRAARKHNVPREEFLFRAIECRVLHSVAGEQLPMTLQARDACGLEKSRDALGRGLDDLGLALLHRRDVELEAAHLDAMRAEFD